MAVAVTVAGFIFFINPDTNVELGQEVAMPW